MTTSKFDAVLNSMIQQQQNDVVDEIRAEVSVAQETAKNATAKYEEAKQDRLDAVAACKAVDKSPLTGKYADEAKAKIMALATPEAKLEELRLEVDKANANLRSVVNLSKEKITPEFVNKVHKLAEEREREKRVKAILLNATLAYQQTIKILPSIADGTYMVEDDDRKETIRKSASKKVGFISRDYREKNGADAKLPPNVWKELAHHKIRTIVMDNSKSEQPILLLKPFLGENQEAKNLWDSWNREIERACTSLYRLVEQDREEYMKAKYPERFAQIEIAKEQRLENATTNGKKNKTRKEVDVKPESIDGLEAFEAQMLASEQ
jgi:hypothetical protein